ncbi:MAG TPA: GTP 3',8-cyclase MoaA [Candidatus Methylomirabilis sp.]|nr:GTP 3',8-cyclase MoaA [Candidatus Methylomirabilis sp.]
MIRDTLDRPLRNLRLSVTDRCNLRCQYCMPEEEYVWLPREDMLTFEEVAALVGVFSDLGVDKVRLTGGEPLLRRGLDHLVAMLAGNPAIRDLAMTTNGVLLAEQAPALRAAGLRRVTVSLDTLRPERFTAFTRRDAHAQVLGGIAAVGRAGWPGLKIDTVVIRGFNDDELGDLIEFGRGVNGEVRFIEYMDVGGATMWSFAQVVGREEMLRRLERRYGAIEAIAEDTSAPAERFRLPDGTVFGIISSTTQPFCRSCDRSRLTADGVWYLCLYATGGVKLGQALRRGASAEGLKAMIASGWQGRDDRGAERRLAQSARGPLIQIGELKRDPHLEMHTRGG